MKHIFGKWLAAAALLVAVPGAMAATMDLTGIGFVQYGDGQSYSLPIADLQIGQSGPGSPFYVSSTPGAIKDLIVVATGAGGTGVTTNIAGIESAYSTPSGVSGSTYCGTTLSAACPLNSGTTGTITNPNVNTWDASLASLKTFLAGDQMLFFFNNNQINSCGAACQSLAAWAQLTVTNGAGTVLGTYDFTNRNTFAGGPGKYDLVANGGGGTFNGSVAGYTSGPGYNAPVAGTNLATDYVLSGGAVCVNTTIAPPLPIPVPCGSPGASAPINHNLGANEAAYAILFPELNALLAGLFANGLLDLTQYTLHVDFRLGCDPTIAAANVAAICAGTPYGRNLNNGFEQIFIGTATTVSHFDVPEPGIIALLALGLLGMAGMRNVNRRRKV